MKFKDIPAGKWFTDCSGRRMIKMQPRNGYCEFMYFSYGVAAIAGTPDALTIQSIPVIEDISCIMENTGLVRAHKDIGTQKITICGFNAVDDTGVMCRCPLDLDFRLESIAG